MKAADLVSVNHGTIITLRPQTAAGCDWIAANVDTDEMPVNIESSYFYDIAVGALRDGLTLQDGATGRMAILPAEEG